MFNTTEHLFKVIRIAILVAIAYVLTLIAVPIIPIAPYLKLDFSDLPILMATVTMGIGAGISVSALAIFLHMLMTGFALPILLGDAVLFISSLTSLLTVDLLINWIRRRRTWQRVLLLIILITVNLTVIMALTNLFTIPLYMRMVGMTINLPVIKILAFGVVPFNIIKGLVIGLLFTVLDRYLQKSKYFK